MIGNGDEFILAACDKKSLVIPVTTHDPLGVLPHGWHFSFGLLEVEV